MNYKVIYDDDNLEFTNNYPALTFLEGDCKNYYRVNDNIIEVQYLDINDINEIKDLKGRYKTIFIILKYIDKERIDKLNNVLKYGNVIVGVRSKEHLSLKKDITLFNVVDNKINLEALINIFSNSEVLFQIKDRNKASSIIMGYETSKKFFSNIQKNVLKSFVYIDGYKEYSMCFYVKKELALEDTANMEDLLREYLYEANKIEIKQFNNSEIKDKVFYSILATR